MSKQYNRGRFTITQNAARDFSIMKHIQRDMVVLRTEENYLRNTVTFYAEGDMFKPIGWCVEVPEYECIITEGEYGEVMVEWREEL